MINNEEFLPGQNQYIYFNHHQAENNIKTFALNCLLYSAFSMLIIYSIPINMTNILLTFIGIKLTADLKNYFFDEKPIFEINYEKMATEITNSDYSSDKTHKIIFENNNSSEHKQYELISVNDINDVDFCFDPFINDSIS